MDMNTQCPKCHRFTVKLDSYFKRDRCMMRDCSWISKGFGDYDNNAKTTDFNQKKGGLIPLEEEMQSRKATPSPPL
jgi:hypothetical protein